MFSTIFSNVASGDLLFSISLLIGTGIFAGFIAGLFGIGGGVVVVPALYYIFTLAEVDESIRMLLQEYFHRNAFPQSKLLHYFSPILLKGVKQIVFRRGMTKILLRLHTTMG